MAGGKPTPKQRRDIDKRKADNHKARLKAAEQEKRVALQVEAIVGEALGRKRAPDTLPDVSALIEKLDRIYDLALVIRMPLAAAKAVELQARLCGLMIERSAVLHAKADARPLLGNPADERQRTIEDLRQQLGSERADRVIAAYYGRDLEKSDDESDE